jgi:hypothetical protein
MSNMQTELQRVFAEWEQQVDATGVKAPEDTNLTAKGQKGFKPTNNVTRATFNYVRDNPGCTRIQATDALTAMGYKISSTASLLSALVKQRQIRALEDGTMYANLTEYAPLKMTISKKARKAKKAKELGLAPQVQKMSLAQMVSAQAPRQERAPAEPVEKRAQLITHRTGYDMDKYIDTLNVRQAKILMQKLKDIFGEGV